MNRDMSLHVNTSTDRVWILIFLLLNSVYYVEMISVSPGEDVLLSCSYNITSTPASSLNVFWRYRDTLNLCDIIAGEADVSSQDPRFRNRTRTFPELYPEGNFSLVLMNVSLNDTGPYNCHIPKVEHRQTLQLTVTVKPTEDPSTAGPGGETTPPRGHSVSVREHTHSLIMLCVTFALRN